MVFPFRNHFLLPPFRQKMTMHNSWQLQATPKTCLGNIPEDTPARCCPVVHTVQVTCSPAYSSNIWHSLPLSTVQEVLLKHYPKHPQANNTKITDKQCSFCPATRKHPPWHRVATLNLLRALPFKNVPSPSLRPEVSTKCSALTELVMLSSTHKRGTGEMLCIWKLDKVRHWNRTAFSQLD